MDALKETNVSGGEGATQPASVPASLAAAQEAAYTDDFDEEPSSAPPQVPAVAVVEAAYTDDFDEEPKEESSAPSQAPVVAEADTHEVVPTEAASDVHPDSPPAAPATELPQEEKEKQVPITGEAAEAAPPAGGESICRLLSWRRAREGSCGAEWKVCVAHRCRASGRNGG